MEIFSFINDILYKKSGDLLKKEEFESEFQPYMIQRWISMYSNSYVVMLNASINKIYGCIKDKSQLYNLFLATVPKTIFKRIKYIKKVSKSSNDQNMDMQEAIKMIANANQISEREVAEYVEEYNLDLKDLIKRIKVCR